MFCLPKGHISTCGLVHYLDKVEADDSVIVKVLKKQGAIPFVKTNIPQSMIKYFFLYFRNFLIDNYLGIKGGGLMEERLKKHERFFCMRFKTNKKNIYYCTRNKEAAS